MSVLSLVALCASLTSSCEDELLKVCPKPWATPAACEKCASKHLPALLLSGCNEPKIKAACHGDAPSPPGSNITKYLLDDGAIDNGGRCLDGTPAGYYYQQANVSMQSTWVIFLEGGGSCYDETSCRQRAKTQLGSSTSWPDGRWPKSFALTTGPDFAGAHHVFVPYCNGDVHSGQRTNATAETWGLYFSGHASLARIVERLQHRHGLGDGARVLLTGQSAGAIGSFLNADWLQEKLGPNVTLKAAPNAGWFFPGDARALPAHVGMPITFADWTATPMRFTNYSKNGTFPLTLWDSFLPASCKSAMATAGLDPSFCISVHNLYPHVRTPTLTIENEFDSYQLSHAAGVPPNPKTPGEKAQVAAYTAYYGELMRNSTAQVVHAKGAGNGLFRASCLSHVVGTDVTVQGYTYKHQLADWFFGRGSIPVVLIDDCSSPDGAPCGAGC
jgi:hypothetical protein